MRNILLVVAGLLLLDTPIGAQPIAYHSVQSEHMLEIVKAEDELRYDRTLIRFLSAPNQHLRKRAALAAGRIGDPNAVLQLQEMLVADSHKDVRQIAAFALGEIESIERIEGLLRVLKNSGSPAAVRARAVEAAGKIAAANAKHEKAKSLQDAIIRTLEFETNRRSRPSKETILLGITAALRAKPEGADKTLVKFLGYADWRIRADALNALARLQAKNADDKARKLIAEDKHPIVRAKAARVLGAAGDKASVDLLMKAATSDGDLRVRINALRALGVLQDPKSGEVLLDRAETLFAGYKESKYANPIEKNELLTISSALGNILKGSDNKRAVSFLISFSVSEKRRSSEIEAALIRVSPGAFLNSLAESKGEVLPGNAIKSLVKNFAEMTKSETSDLVDGLTVTAIDFSKRYFAEVFSGNTNPDQSFPAMLRTYATFKMLDREDILINSLEFDDVIIRSTAAGLLGEIKPQDGKHASKLYRVLSNALWRARTDKLNDASLSILDAMKKQYENRPIPQTLKIAYMTPFISSMGSPDYLIRRRAARIYKGFNIRKPNPMTAGNPGFKPFEIPGKIGVIKSWEETDKNGSKSRVLRTDYGRAISRKNGYSKAVLKTDKGEFTINFFSEQAPLTVDNFIRLARTGYFNGVEIHRVVPNFVVQDGDPRGDGNGGPGWHIRCEINQIPYERGMVGMALSGKDTGGSQWFVTHAPQPHLDGGYTIFGKVNERDMTVVDSLVRGDKIIGVMIVEKETNARY